MMWGGGVPNYEETPVSKGLEVSVDGGGSWPSEWWF